MMKEKWFAKDGSVFSTKEKQKPVQDFKQAKNIKYHDCVAFNVGETVAEHIVSLHNKNLETANSKNSS